VRIYIVEDGRLVSYERTGQCNRCGECCHKHIGLQITTNTFNPDYEPGADDEANWDQYEGFSILLAHGVWWYFKITYIKDMDGACPGLRNGNECDVWMDASRFRPVCRYWPFNPRDMDQFQKCGFSFEKVPE